MINEEMVGFTRPAGNIEELQEVLSIISSASHDLTQIIDKVRGTLIDLVPPKSYENVHRNISIVLADAESVHLRTSLACMYIDRVIEQKGEVI